ncbi:MAG: glycosyltransferase [Candidatus Paceibacterota bacterium]|jgi:glycosyltransferase involved in cell wall biosynthesis
MLSIIIPTYNEEKYIGESLEQFKQKLTLPHEIIVSDDKSTDKTVEIAKSFQDVTVLVPEKKHQAIGANRNEGARTAKGDFFVFMDGDSRIENPDKFFSTILEYFEANKNVVAVTTYLQVLKECETFTDRFIYIIFNWTHVLKNNIFHTGEASGKFQMIRKEAFLKVNGYREDLVSREDANMFQRLSEIGRTICLSNLRVFHYGRRAHRIGWPKLLYIWMTETLYVAINDRSIAKEWKDVR